jgi:hypothetical protein
MTFSFRSNYLQKNNCMQIVADAHKNVLFKLVLFCPTKNFVYFCKPNWSRVKLFFDVKFNNSNMSRAFREGKTEKTKSALNLFYAVFFEGNSEGIDETEVSNK